jgi:hypothetical protein
MVGGLPAYQVFVTVPNVAISMSNVSVGNNLAASAFVTLNSPAPGTCGQMGSGLSIQVTAGNSNALLSNTLDGTGSNSITVLAPACQLQSNSFYVYGAASSGSSTLSLTSNYGPATATVTLTPSAIVIAGPSGTPGAGITTTNNPSPLPMVNLDSVQLTGVGGTILSFQPLAGAQNVTLSAIGGIGTIPSPVAFAAGTGTVQTTFTPAASGNFMGGIAVTEPSGFSNPATSLSGIAVTVSTAGISITGDSINGAATIGQNLEVMASVSLGQYAPSGGVTVTLTAQAGVLLSTDPTMAGTSTLMINIAGGTNSASFYIQANTTVGGATPTYTATAPGYNSKTSLPITIAASEPFISGPNGLQPGNGNPITVTHGTSESLTVYMVLVNGSGNAVSTQMLAGGHTLSLTINSTNGNAGTITPNPVTVNAGDNGDTFMFNATTAGQSTTLSISGGAGPTFVINVN